MWNFIPASMVWPAIAIDMTNPQTKIQKTYVKWNHGSIWSQNLIEPYWISVGEADFNAFLSGLFTETQRL